MRTRSGSAVREDVDEGMDGFDERIANAVESIGRLTGDGGDSDMEGCGVDMTFTV